MRIYTYYIAMPLCLLTANDYLNRVYRRPNNVRLLKIDHNGVR